jgi:hypothetical protein
MSLLRLGGLAIVLVMLALPADGASACGLLWWRCEVVYPPMYVPPYDPRRGPVWTNNGWSYPQVPAWAAPVPYAYGPPVAPAQPWPVPDYGRPLK